MKPIISETGIINGRGKLTYKWVSSLTKDEREACRRGEIVLVKDNNTHHTTTDYKQVVYSYGKYKHRNYYGEVDV